MNKKTSSCFVQLQPIRQEQERSRSPFTRTAKISLYESRSIARVFGRPGLRRLILSLLQPAYWASRYDKIFTPVLVMLALPFRSLKKSVAWTQRKSADNRRKRANYGSVRTASMFYLLLYKSFLARSSFSSINVFLTFRVLSLRNSEPALRFDLRICVFSDVAHLFLFNCFTSFCASLSSSAILASTASGSQCSAQPQGMVSLKNSSP